MNQRRNNHTHTQSIFFSIFTNGRKQHLSPTYSHIVAQQRQALIALVVPGPSPWRRGKKGRRSTKHRPLYPGPGEKREGENRLARVNARVSRGWICQRPISRVRVLSAAFTFLPMYFASLLSESTIESAYLFRTIASYLSTICVTCHLVLP